MRGRVNYGVASLPLFYCGTMAIGMPGSGTHFARILERQKLLQTSQVLFRHLCVSYVALLPFKDSQGETWPLELSDLEEVPLGCTCQ